MPEKIIRVVEKQFFAQTIVKDGQAPIAPPEAVEEYERLTKEWLLTFPPIQGIEPRLTLSPVRRGEETRYVITREYIYDRDMLS